MAGVPPRGPPSGGPAGGPPAAKAVSVDDGVEPVALGPGVADGVGVLIIPGVVSVAVRVGVLEGVGAETQSVLVMVLVSNVTAPFLASSLPWKVAPVCAVIDV